MAMEKAKKWAVRLAAMAALTLCGVIPAALADTQPTYDRRIEEAAIRMLQPKLGDMRGSLDLNTGNHLYPPLSRRIAAPKMATPTAGGEIEGSFIRY